MRSERVVVRVVVLEGKASAAQMKQFTHLTAIKTPILVRVLRQKDVLQTTDTMSPCEGDRIVTAVWGVLLGHATVS